MKFRVLSISILFLSTIMILTFGFKPKQRNIVEIVTKYGTIKIKLYDQTPKHKENFIKLIKQNFYDDLLFHRVIKDFMIQGGDPDSKNAAPNISLGNGGPGYTIPAEFNPELFHKKGVLAAARESDNINPNKESSGSQFYIVQGKIFSNTELDALEKRINQNYKNQVYNKILSDPKNISLRLQLDSIQKLGSKEAMSKFFYTMEPIVNEELSKQKPFKFTEDQRKIYSTVGGTPHLDGNYTVFGEVIEGLNIIDSIANVKTDQNDRPIEDVKMTIKYINK